MRKVDTVQLITGRDGLAPWLQASCPTSVARQAGFGGIFPDAAAPIAPRPTP